MSLRTKLNCLLCLLCLNFSVTARAEDVVLGCVDCYSSMSLIDQIFHELFPDKSARWVLYQSHPYSTDQENYLSYFPEDRVLERVRLQPLPDGVTDEVAAELARARNVKHVFGGMDLGSQRAPNLNRLLGFRDNSVEGARVRIEKYLSSIVSGRYAIPTRRLIDAEDAIKWVAGLPNKEIIVKPVVGVLGKDTQILDATDVARLRIVFDGLLDTNQAFILQPRITGRKFFANTYTKAGVTKVVSAAEYFQFDHRGKPNYFLNGFLSLTSPEADLMQEVSNYVMPAHHIEFGMAHPEFILDQESGHMYLLEMNGRVAGAGIPEVDKRIYGTSQLHLHLMAIIDPERFDREFGMFPTQRKQTGFMFFVSSPAPGRWKPAAIQAINSSPSYFLPGAQYAVRPNASVEPTVSMDTVQGIFYLLGDHAQVRRDVHQMTSMFEEGRMLDHSTIVDREGVVVAKACDDRLREASVGTTRLARSMRAALGEIDWDKF